MPFQMGRTNRTIFYTSSSSPSVSSTCELLYFVEYYARAFNFLKKKRGTESTKNFDTKNCQRERLRAITMYSLRMHSNN